MSQSYKICPICGTPAPKNAALCGTCGTSLADIPAVSSKPQRGVERHYERKFGETDLLEQELSRRGAVITTVIITLAGVALCAALVIIAVPRVQEALSAARPAADSPAVGTSEMALSTGGTPTASAAVILATNTPRPTLSLPTVTPAPPTATSTPTPGPCIRQVQAGDDLISLAWSCGHRSLDVIPLILEENGLDAPESLQQGQELVIPWPTETPDPNAAFQSEATSAGEIASADSAALASVMDSPSSAPPAGTTAPTTAPSPTLLPGITWHIVQPGESMVTIAIQYNTSAEVLAQLNPEIPFSQCDFSVYTGGPRCTVLLQQGQQMRVPAPTPTPTLSPTLTGSETPTPTATPTFNAPSALSPGNRALFRHGEFVTLRWVTTGTLGEREVYRVIVRDLTARIEYVADTTELFYILPPEWQGTDARRHEYEWSVSVIHLDRPEQPLYTTETRLFSWEGRGEAGS